MGYNTLKSLIYLVDRYEQESGGNDDIADFLRWAYQDQNINHSAKRSDLDIPAGENLEGVLSKYVVFLYRYARSYVKKALESTALHHFDDFAFLVTLFRDKSLSKSELIRKNIMDKSSGMEVLKRLIHKGFIAETLSQMDMRRKTVSLTESGMKALLQTFEKMGEVAALISGTLNENEKIRLFELLQKLHLFHLPIFLEQRKEEIGVLLMQLEQKKAGL